MSSPRSFCFVALEVLILSTCVLVKADELPRRAMFGASVAADSAGARVNYVVPGSPAEKAGLKAGDLLTRFAARSIKSPADVVEAVRSTPVGQQVDLQIVREGAAQSLRVTLAPAPKENDSDVETIYGAIPVEGTLRRTLVTVPRNNNQKLPAILIVGGIGCYTVDNPNDPYDAYRLLAHDLGRARIVVMRLEKSGVGDSQGAPCFDTDFNAESLSYKIALQALRGDPRVDPERVFVFGHSIGAVISPRLALEASVAGIIFAEGVGRNWFEYELLNLRRQAELEGDSPTEVDATLRSKELCMHRLLIERQGETEIERDMPECKARNRYPVGAAYVQQVAALNIVEPWTHIAVPVLGIYGTGDFVATEEDHRRIVSIVNKNHSGSAELRTIGGMDHHLGAAGTPQEAYDLRVKNHKEAPYEKRLSTEIANWICTQTRCG